MTAENILRDTPPAAINIASMRPRPMTAENPGVVAGELGRRRRFNEAAADDRGKRQASSSIASRSTTLQ